MFPSLTDYAKDKTKKTKTYNSGGNKVTKHKLMVPKNEYKSLNPIYKEDRKDARTRIQASQQSELIDQRNSGKPPKSFESAGNDILGGVFDLGALEPR